MLRSLCAVAALIFATPAAAHIVFSTPEADANSYYAGFLQIGHGCGASPTVSLRVEIPEGLDSVRPQPKPGWTLEIERTPLATPLQTEGGMVTERVSAITWTGNLPADQFDIFGLMMHLPQTPGPLYFPAVQTCAEGENRWVEIPAPGAAWGSVPRPAPVLTLNGTPPVGVEHEHHH